jgi:hypothetical protein
MVGEFTDRHCGDVISLLSYFENMESRIKIIKR